MNTSLTDSQIATYREDGYLKIDRFLQSEEVEELKSAVLEAARLLGKKSLADSKDDWREAKPETYYGMIFTQKINLWRISPTVKQYMLSPELGKMLCRLAGMSGFRVWHDQTLIKEPFANSTAFHLDNPYWSFHSRDAISIWIALEDAMLENGCMWFQPGSQKQATYQNVGIGENIGELFKVYPGMAKIDPVPVPMKAGDCSFHNGLLSHGAGPNMTRKRRIAMTCAYMPEGSTFNGNPNILPREYLQTLKVGDILANDDWNPSVGRM